MASNFGIYLKLLIDKENNKVLYAECGKEFVDFLFSLLRMRMGTMVRLLGKQSMVGCLDKLYESAGDFNGPYMLEPKENKKALLKPSFVPRFPIKNFQLFPPLTQRKRKGSTQSKYNLLISTTRKAAKKNEVYTCSKCHWYVSYISGPECPGCCYSLSYAVKVVDPKPSRGTEVHEALNRDGTVRGLVMYMVTDDLVVTPLSTASCLATAEKFNIRDITKLEQKMCILGTNEARDLIKTAFHSKSVAMFSARLRSLQLQVTRWPQLTKLRQGFAFFCTY